MFCVFSVRFRFLSLPRVAASCVFYSRRLTRINNTSFVIYVPEDIVFIFHATRSDSRLELGPELPPPPPTDPVSCPSHGSFAETISSLCVRLQIPLHCCFAVVVSLSLALPVSLTLGISTLYLYPLFLPLSLSLSVSVPVINFHLAHLAHLAHLTLTLPSLHASPAPSTTPCALITLGLAPP